MSLTYGFNLGAAGATYAAEQFTDVFAHLVGDTVTDFGTGFEITLNSLLSFTIGTGYLYANGYWLKNRYPQTFSLEGAYLSGPRYDALAAVVNYSEREVSLQVLTDIDPDAQGETADGYRAYLYVFKVEAGAVELFRSSVTDKRTMLQRLDDTSVDVSAVYEYCTNQFAGVIDDFEDDVDTIIAAADTAASGAVATVYDVMGIAVGLVRQTGDHPTPINRWLACDGSAFTGYSALASVLGSSTAPDLEADDPRVSCWIYAGPPDTT